jgi:multiple sugar transport system ATP-binding protein
MARLVLEHVSKVFPAPRGAGIHALNDLSLEVRDGELLALVGPSGCGKTTTLRLIAGLDPVTAGRIHLDGRDVTLAPPQARNVGMVFQSGALYPHLTAADNLALGLRLRRVATDEISRRVREAARLLGLADLLARRPGELSGGERQRVALGRALVTQPQILLLDEPLAALDAPLRTQLRRDIARLHRERGGATIHVTHDQAEALALGDRVAILRAGELQQLATPAALFHEPANLFVAGFIGSPPMNLIPGRLAPDGAGLQFVADSTGEALSIRLPPAAASALSARANSDVTLGLRAGNLELAPGEERAAAGFVPARVESVEFAGAGALAQVTTAGQTLVVCVDRERLPAAGEKVSLRIRLEAAHWFDSATGRRVLAVSH